MGNSWAKIKKLSLEFLWDEQEQEPPIDEKTKNLLIQACNSLCPGLDTGEVQYTRRLPYWSARWGSGRGSNRGRFTWTGGSAVALFSVEEHETRE
jgi:hypothetical protein